MTIGERIKALRKKNGLTQEKLAENLGVSYQAVSKWECNVSIPDINIKTAKDALMLCDDGKILLKYLENEIL